MVVDMKMPIREQKEHLVLVHFCILQKQALGVYPEQIGVKGYSFWYDEAILGKKVDHERGASLICKRWPSRLQCK